jgi:hypothetical protein
MTSAGQYGVTSEVVCANRPRRVRPLPSGGGRVPQIGAEVAALGAELAERRLGRPPAGGVRAARGARARVDAVEHEGGRRAARGATGLGLADQVAARARSLERGRVEARAGTRSCTALRRRAGRREERRPEQERGAGETGRWQGQAR